jgi:hypothetical protein
MSMRATVAITSLAAVAVAAYALLAYTPLGLGVAIRLKQNPGEFDRQRFEAVVSEVRLLGLKPGDTAHLRLDDIAIPKSLRSIKAGEMVGAGNGVGNVWATISASGKLKVVIETRDLGHAGKYGFAYSDAPLAPVSSSWSKDISTLDVPWPLQFVQPEMKIDDHWWEVYNNED